MPEATSTIWIALLRGINVGGHRKVSMANLRSLCLELGFASVSTYIQSGNVVFRAAGTAADVADRLAEGISARFGLDVPVVVRDADQMARVVASNPFLDEDRDPKALHVGFLADPPAADLVDAMPVPPAGPEEFVVRGGEVFLLYPEGVGQSKLTGAYFEGALKTSMTARNWRTVNKLLEMARDA